MVKNIFTPEVTQEIVGRIDRLTPESQPLWGKMSVSKMLAHCCVAYEMVYEEDRFVKPGFFMRFVLKNMVKPKVVNEVAYKPNGPTAPAFVIRDEKNFSLEKPRLIAFIERTQQLGGAHFEGKISHSFGKMSQNEWNNMFYKHLDHHLRQFGV